MSRAAGWRLPDGAVYVGRPTRWGNPFRIGAPGLRFVGPVRGGAGRYGGGWVGADFDLDLPLPAQMAVALYRLDLDAALEVRPEDHPEDREWALELRRDLLRLSGRDLACWCRLDRPCHADVLLERANDVRLLGGNYGSANETRPQSGPDRAIPLHEGQS